VRTYDKSCKIQKMEFSISKTPSTVQQHLPNSTLYPHSSTFNKGANLHHSRSSDKLPPAIGRDNPNGEYRPKLRFMWLKTIGGVIMVAILLQGVGTTTELNTLFLE